MKKNKTEKIVNILKNVGVVWKKRRSLMLVLGLNKALDKKNVGNKGEVRSIDIKLERMEVLKAFKIEQNEIYSKLFKNLKTFYTSKLKELQLEFDNKLHVSINKAYSDAKEFKKLGTEGIIDEFLCDPMSGVEWYDSEAWQRPNSVASIFREEFFKLREKMNKSDSVLKLGSNAVLNHIIKKRYVTNRLVMHVENYNVNKILEMRLFYGTMAHELKLQYNKKVEELKTEKKYDFEELNRFKKLEEKSDVNVFPDHELCIRFQNEIEVDELIKQFLIVKEKATLENNSLYKFFVEFVRDKQGFIVNPIRFDYSFYKKYSRSIMNSIGFNFCCRKCFTQLFDTGNTDLLSEQQLVDRDLLSSKLVVKYVDAFNNLVSFFKIFEKNCCSPHLPFDDMFAPEYVSKKFRTGDDGNYEITVTFVKNNRGYLTDLHTVTYQRPGGLINPASGIKFPTRFCQKCYEREFRGIIKHESYVLFEHDKIEIKEIAKANRKKFVQLNTKFQNAFNDLYEFLETRCTKCSK